MNLLIISNNPDRASFRQRIEIYLDILRANGINCEVTKLPAGFLARRSLFKKAADFDGVFLHKKTLNFFDAHYLRKYSRKIVYDFDDAMMYSDKHPNKPSYKRRESFRRTVKLADMVIAGNSYLAEHAKKFNNCIKILPTGLDTNEYENCKVERKDNKVRLVWIGCKSTLRYLFEIKPALEQIGLRFNNVVLRIICDEFFDLQNMPVEKHCWSLETQVFDLAASDIGLSPLPSDNFTRGKSGGLKILQYAAAGLPVIASLDVNAEGIREGINGFLAGDCSDWIEKMSRLLSDSQLRKQMGEAGKMEVRQFDLKVVGEQFASLVKESLEDAKT
jgi:glycosyltransferase involved in cell wall biosynthesis